LRRLFITFLQRLRSVERIIKDRVIHTTRKSGLADIDKGAAILNVIEEDPLGRWGVRKIKEKLALDQVLLPAMWILVMAAS
jgi:hypothetical protein